MKLAAITALGDLGPVAKGRAGALLDLTYEKNFFLFEPFVGAALSNMGDGAIPTLTRVMAVELGTRNPAVRVNCILPGPVMLPADLPEAEKRHAINATLVKREGRPENIAQAVLFLVENDFVTGVCLPVDGGRNIFAPDSAD